MSDQTHELEPYIGPRPYKKEEGEFFFGRRLEVNDLISLITANQVVLLYAQSGAGKTSLLKASLIPQLEDEENFRVLEPARVKLLQTTLEVNPADIRNIFVFNSLTSWNNKKLSQAQLAQMSLKDFLKHNREVGAEGSGPLVIVFDQFEELFTHHLDRWEDRKDFFDQVNEALEEDSDLRVYFVMREDYIAELDPYAQILPGKLRTRFRMERLRRENALSAIKGPLEAPSVKDKGRRFAEGVAEALVDDLLKVRVQTSGGEKEVPGQFVEPVQLQVVCQTLWHELKPQDKIITFDHLKAFGDVNQALTKFFDNTIEKASKASGVSGGALRRWFDRVLITPEGNRGTVQRGNDETAGLPNSAIEVFESERLLRSEPRDGRLWYELSQDRLIRPIQNSYKEWLAKQPGDEQTRLRLEDQASTWWRTRDRNLLLDPGQLLIARRWIEEEARGGYSEALYALVQASEAEIERTERARERELAEEQKLRAEAETERAAALEATAQEQRLRADEKALAYSRMRYLAAGLAVVLLISVASTVYAFRQRENAQRSAALALENAQEARRQQQNAEEQKTQAEARRLEAEEARKIALVASENEREARLAAEAAEKEARELALAEKGLKQKALSAEAEAIRQTEEAVRQTKRANEAAAAAQILRDEAQKKEGVSKSQALAANALLQLSTDPELGLLLAIKATEPENAPKEARDALLKALEEFRLRSVLKTNDELGMLTAAFAPNGTVLTVGEDGNVKEWKGAEGRNPQQTSIVDGGAARATASAFSPDNRMLATANADNSVQVRNLKEPGSPITLEGLGNFARRIAITNDGTFALLSGGSDVLVYDLRRETPVAFLRPKDREEDSRVNSLEFSSDGELAVVAFGKGAQIWKTGAAERAVWTGSVPAVEEFPRLTLGGHVGQVNSASISPDKTLVVTASDDRTARLWEWEASKLKYQFIGHESGVTDASFSPDGKLIVTAGNDGTARVWDVETGRSVVVLRGHKAALTSASFSGDGQYVVTTGEDKTTRVWQLNLQEKSRALKGHVQPLSDVAISPNGKLIVTSSYDNTARIWDFKTGKHIGDLRGQLAFDQVTFSDDKTIFTVDRNEVRKWEVNNTNQSVAISGKWVSPDGKLIAGEENGNIRVSEASSGRVIATLPRAAQLTMDDYIVAVAFSPDNKSLVITSTNGALYLWKFIPPGSLTILKSEGASLRGAAYSPSGTYLCTWGGRTAWIWEPTTGLNLSILNGHTDAILDASFSRDERFLVTASRDKTARVWGVESGESVVELRGHTDAVSSAVFDPDSQRVITSSYDRTARIFECRECAFTQDILQLARTYGLRSLTDEERQRFETPSIGCTDCGDLSALRASACERITRDTLSEGEKSKFSIEGSEKEPVVCKR